jgi:DNA polymerase III subunit alpha, Gram-positive type
LKKLVKEVFFNVDIDSEFLNATVDEVKFSKKLNSVILKTSSKLNISVLDINEFEKIACKSYDLSNFKVEYKYMGDIEKLDNDKVFGILKESSKFITYLEPLLEIIEVEVNEVIEIKLLKPYSRFLTLKKMDDFIKKSIYIKYGNSIEVVFKDLTNEFEQRNSNLVELPKLKINNTEVEKNNQSVKTNYPKREKAPKFEKNMPDYVIIGNDISSELTDKIIKLNLDYDRTCISGQICSSDSRKLKSGKYLISFNITDFTSTISCKMFLNEEDAIKIKSKLSVGEYVKVMGKVQFDTYAKEITVMVNSIVLIEKPTQIIDEADEKRVELHIHTQMSSMDGVTSASDIVKRAIKWGHKAIAITDHGVAQSFPEAHMAISKAYAKEIQEGRIISFKN